MGGIFILILSWINVNKVKGAKIKQNKMKSLKKLSNVIKIFLFSLTLKVDNSFLSVPLTFPFIKTLNLESQGWPPSIGQDFSPISSVQFSPINSFSPIGLYLTFLEVAKSKN